MSAQDSVNYVATLRLDRQFMSESFDQARRYGSRWYLVEYIVGAAFIVGGLILFVYVDWATVLPIALVAIGVFELLSSRIKKYFWLRKHGKAKAANQKVEMVFNDEGFETKSDFSTAHMVWDGVERCVRTPKGILLWPQKGMYFYIPEDSAGAEVVAFIESRVARAR